MSYFEGDVKNVAVIGAGAMGSGIAASLVLNGFKVIMIDIKPEFVDKGLSNIKRILDSRVKKEVITSDQANEYLKSVKTQVDYDNLAEIDFVIEAALEKIDVKTTIFCELDKISKKSAVIASNTSALSISELASHTNRSDRVIGMHFFNPAHVMKLVEVIPGLKTSQKTIETTQKLAKSLGKVGVVVNECPGFLVNRLLFPYMNEALYALELNLASIVQIDEMAVQFGLPMGPFTLMDMTGLDVCLDVNDFLYNEYGERFKTNKLLKLMVENGLLGQKSKAGFFVHDPSLAYGANKEINPKVLELLSGLRKTEQIKDEFSFNQVILPMFNEAIYAYQEKVVELADIDVAMSYGCGLKRGILSLSNEHGLKWCLAQIEKYHVLYGERFRPSWFLKKIVRSGIYNIMEMTDNSQKDGLSLAKLT